MSHKIMSSRLSKYCERAYDSSLVVIGLKIQSLFLTILLFSRDASKCCVGASYYSFFSLVLFLSIHLLGLNSGFCFRFVHRTRFSILCPLGSCIIFMNFSSKYYLQLVKDYQAWASGDTSRQALGTGEI